MPTTPTREVIIDRMQGGMLRITIEENGIMANRRRDVPPERQQEVTAALLAELDTTPALRGEALRWESAGTDDPGDQEATSATGPRAFWSVGPAAGGTWIAELVHLDETGAELPYGVLLRCGGEDAAKDAAARYEREHVSPEA